MFQAKASIGSAELLAPLEARLQNQRQTLPTMIFSHPQAIPHLLLTLIYKAQTQALLNLHPRRQADQTLHHQIGMIILT